MTAPHASLSEAPFHKGSDPVISRFGPMFIELLPGIPILLVPWSPDLVMVSQVYPHQCPVDDPRGSSHIHKELEPIAPEDPQ